jgi:hypothetical protein
MDETKAQALTKYLFMLAAYPDFDDMRICFKTRCSYCEKNYYLKELICRCRLEKTKACTIIWPQIEFKLWRNEKHGLKPLIKSMINAIWEA